MRIRLTGGNSFRLPKGRYALPVGAVGVMYATEEFGTSEFDLIGAPHEQAEKLASNLASMQGSPNWSGYVFTKEMVTGVAATWTVPTVRADVDGLSCTWVGIDGGAYGDDALFQCGTEQDYNPPDDPSSRESKYYAWWEKLPNEQVRIYNADLTEGRTGEATSEAPVSPGDKMVATIFPAEGQSAKPFQTATWVITVSNLNSSHAWTFSKEVAFTALSEPPSGYMRLRQ